jgi:integrase/recombinase XerD
MAKVYDRPDSPYKWGRFTYQGIERRKSLETTSDRLANERLIEWIAEVKSGKGKVDKWEIQRLFEDAANKFIDEHFPRLKPKAAKRYRVSLMHWTDFFASTNPETGKQRVVYLDDITKSVLSDFEVMRRKQGRANGTIRRDFACLGALFSCADDWEWVPEDHNPATRFVRKAEKRGLVEAEARRRVFRPAEESRLLDYIRHKQVTVKGNRDRHAWMMLEAVVIFGIDAGLRAEEMLSLTWDKIDLDTKEVTVDWSVAKSSRSRIVPILPRSLKVLRALKHSEHSNYVFWCRDGKRYTHMYQQVVRACKALQIHDIEFHDLRRTCGARLLRVHRMSMERVQLWLGHESLQQTQRAYAWLEKEDLHLAVSESPALATPHESRHDAEVISADFQKICAIS